MLRVIRFEDVTKSYKRGGSPALQDVSVEVQEGELVFLVGPSGSGKSTFLRMLLRETKPTTGQVIVNDVDLAKLRSRKVAKYRRTVGAVFQDFRLLNEKTVERNVGFALEVIGTPRKQVKERVAEALELVGLEELAKRKPDQLSGGEQQRVAIARAFVNHPTILIADEPTGNLDPATSQDIMDLLVTINERGTTVLVATHDARIVDKMQKRVIELANGVLMRDEAQGSYLVGGDSK